MAYIELGPRTKTAAADQTGFNAGNLTTSFGQADMNVSVQVPMFEVYKIVVTNVPAGGNATVYHNNNRWSFTYPNIGSEWDPSQPKQMRASDQLDLRWNIAAGGQAPVTTIWLRYDPALTDIYGVT